MYDVSFFVTKILLATLVVLQKELLYLIASGGTFMAFFVLDIAFYKRQKKHGIKLSQIYIIGHVLVDLIYGLNVYFIYVLLKSKHITDVEFSITNHAQSIKMIKTTLVLIAAIKILAFVVEIGYYIRYYIMSKSENTVQQEVLDNLEKTKIMDKKIVSTIQNHINPILMTKALNIQQHR